MALILHSLGFPFTLGVLLGNLPTIDSQFRKFHHREGSLLPLVKLISQGYLPGSIDRFIVSMLEVTPLRSNDITLEVYDIILKAYIYCCLATGHPCA